MLVRIALCLMPLTFLASAACGDDASRPNLLIITVDDMSADSLGAFGCKLEGTSPSIDAFARGSLRLNRAHVQVGNCMPGRNIMWSGMFSHVNGVEGFVQNPDADYPVLCDLAKDAGYFAAIRGKVSHSTPYSPYAWDAILDTSADGRKWHPKDAASYGQSTRQGIELAKQSGKPFCLLINISDPHKPFYAQGKDGATSNDPHVPTRVFEADEVPVPGFLPDDEVIRKELAHYYSSVRRADDCFASVMDALNASGQTDRTFVLFFSDHGMPLPFAKTQLYHHSTHTPMIVRWPGVTTAGSVDDAHMVSAVDLVPTLLDVMQHEHPTPERLHGRSFATLIRGQSQADRDYVILQYNENSGRWRHPMRGIHTRDFLYLYNPWSDGSRKFATATTGTMTYRQMVKRAGTETAIAARLELFDHRVLEELYDVSSDPDCLNNLIDSPDHQKTLRSLRQQLATSLTAMKDPVAPLVSAVDDDSLREAYMEAEDQRSQRARNAKNKKAASRPNAAAKRPQLPDAITMEVPKSVSSRARLSVRIRHHLPADLGPQKLYVTLKTANGTDRSGGQRVHREILMVSGDGEVHVEFAVPAAIESTALQVAAFVGEDFGSNLQHLNSPRIQLRD